MEKTRMNKTDKMLFRQALTEAFVRKYERELNECQETAVCSEAHTRRMNEIISQSAQRERRRDRRKWIVALLVAAALLLTACSVYAYQDEIRSFIEKVYEDYIKVTYDDESENQEMKIISEYYTLGYVPDGYTLTKEIRLQSSMKCIWKNAEDQYLIFEQRVIDGTDYGLDGEVGETNVIVCGEYSVYCRSGNVYTYIWNDGNYSFMITTPDALSDDMLIRLVESIEIAE